MKAKRIKPIIIGILACIAILAGIFFAYSYIHSNSNNILNAHDDYPLNIYFFDVGKADSMLIACDGEFALIDAGTQDVGTDVCDYLNTIGVTQLKSVFLTHPDKDHVGGMSDVLTSFEVLDFVQSPIEESVLPDSDEYNSCIVAAEALGLSEHYASVGDVFELGGATLTVMAPLDSYDDTNNSSIVLKLEYGEFSALFCGDIEKSAQKDMVAAYTEGELSADVIKIPHHGSSDAAKKSFLQAVNPTYAVISTSNASGKELPSEEVLEKLANLQATVYRTDQNGHIVCSTDGSKIVFNVQTTMG